MHDCASVIFQLSAKQLLHNFAIWVSTPWEVLHTLVIFLSSTLQEQSETYDFYFKQITKVIFEKVSDKNLKGQVVSLNSFLIFPSKNLELVVHFS